MFQSYAFLILLLIIALIAKNQSLLIAVLFLTVLKVFGFDSKTFSFLHSKGINWGVTVITIAVLAPIASGEIGFKELTEAFKSPAAWIALLSGVAVAMIAKGGISLLIKDPHITTALVIGTIFAVSVFKGIAVGPLIGAGIAYYSMKAFEVFKGFFQ